MDETHHQEENRELPIKNAPFNGPSAVDIIRTETVLSRMPRHVLSKSGKRPEIRLEKFTDAGKLDMRWWVSFNELYGPARQLAYDLDTLIVERAIEETFDQARRAGQSLPRLIPIGSVRDLCRKLGLEENGTNIVKIKRAMQQNAGAVINAIITYQGTDKSEITIDGTFTCYGVFFTGKKLPDGRRADQTYISTTNEYHQVLSTAPTRPLDYSYKIQLAPTPRRLYEILSYPMYGALMNNKRFATLLYSDYCMRAPHVRYFTFEQVKKQMYTVNKPHKESGYITRMKYEYLADPQGNADWMLLYEPGPRARSEFQAIHRGKRTIASAAGDSANYRRVSPSQHHLKLKLNRAQVPSMMTPRPNLDPRLISEFTKRGITEAKAIQLIADSKPGQDLVAQLELTDNIIEHAGFTIKNPPGFYIRQIERNMPVPENFETSAKRNVRAEAERKDTERRASEEARQFLEDEYERYCIIETDRYVAEHPDIYAPIREAKLQEERRWSTGFSLSSTETMATISAKYEIRKRIPLLTFDEFVERRKQGSEPPLTETIPAVAAEPAVSVPDDLLAAEELREAKISTTTHSQENSPSASEVAKAIEPLAPGPLMIEVVSDPLTEEISEPPMAEAA